MNLFKNTLEYKMMNMIKLLASVLLLNLMFSQTGVAKLKLTKSEIKAQATEVCREYAIKKYGEESIDEMGKKAKLSRNTSRVNWNSSLQGALVKMVVKQKSKGLVKLSCLFDTKGKVTFIKR